MTNCGRILRFSSVVCVAALLAACGEDALTQPGDPEAPMQGSDAATGPAGSDGGVVDGTRCDLPAGWPTLDSVLSMAEALPETGDVQTVVMTSQGPYWLGESRTALYRLGTDGNAELVATTDLSGSPRLVASDSAVVWYWDSSIWALLLDAGVQPTELATDVSLTGSLLFVDETHVYYEPAFDTPGLTRIALAGGDPEDLPYVAEVLAVHDGYAYYAETVLLGDILMRTPVDGTEIEELTEPMDLFSAQIVFGGNVMYIAGGGYSVVSRIEIGSPASESIVHRRAAADRGSSNIVERLFLDGDRLVFADWKGYIGWATTDGTQCANILVDPEQGLGTFGVPVDIALDDEYLYLLPLLESSYSGKLYRIARPMVGL